jgi:DNA-binding transcriptional MerR regulator
MATYSFKELVKATGVTAPSLRHWVRRGVVPGPVLKGANTRWDDAHYLRTLAAKRLSATGMHLDAMAQRLQSATVDELHDIAGLPRPVVPAPPTPPKPPPPTVPEALAPYRAAAAHGRALWEVIALCDGVALHVRADADTEARRVVREIEKAFVPGAGE